MHDEARSLSGRRALATLLIAVSLVGGCVSSTPTPPVPTPEPTASPIALATPSASSTPQPSVGEPPTFPLAVVTGLTNPAAGITLKQLTALATTGDLVRPCGIDVLTPALPSPPPGLMSGSHPPCVAADAIAALLRQQPSDVALLPAGLVEPATRTLPVDGKGPFGLFGADLFGDPSMRDLPYPITGRATPGTNLDAAWAAYDPATVWTMSSVGGVCSDRGAAWQALELRKGWGWLFDGGTARYAGKPRLDPDPPTGISPHIVVTPVETDRKGAVATGVTTMCGLMPVGGSGSRCGLPA